MGCLLPKRGRSEPRKPSSGFLGFINGERALKPQTCTSVLLRVADRFVG